MTKLALYALSLILAKFPPGKKHQSLEELTACGTDPKAPTCELAPVCERPDFVCRAPWWEPRYDAFPEPRGAWVRVESREAGAERLEIVAQALADATEHALAAPMTQLPDVWRVWPRGSADLLRVAISNFGWSNGFREDIQIGRILGPAGETCLVDVQLPTLRKWTTPELAALSDHELRSAVAGRTYESLRRCFDAGMVGILAHRRDAIRTCSQVTMKVNPLPNAIRVLQPMELSLFALYHMGTQCKSGPPNDWADDVRYKTLLSLRARTATYFPDWYNPPD